MTRKLSGEESDLWDRVRRSARPLKRARPEKLTAARAAEAKPRNLRNPAPDVTRPPGQREPSLAPLEDRLRRRLGRGLTDVDARIDLHGMRQERAFGALFSFLRHAQARGSRIVLVVTGKGRAGEDGRGVLRQAVPEWLARPDMRELIVGFEPASRRHGGEGALYVRVRRRRSTAQ